MRPTTRRKFLLAGAVAAMGALAGCATASPRGSKTPLLFTDRERNLLAAKEPTLAIVQRGGPDSAVLRSRAREVTPGVDLADLGRRMEAAMEQAQGVGLAGPQVGISLRVVVVKLDYKTDRPHNHLAINPVILERSDDTIAGYEGCLSIAGVGGKVQRNRWIRIRFADDRGQIHEQRAEGANAVLWQHELDHLDGVLYVDRLQGELLPMEEVRRLRREAESQAAPAGDPVSWQPPPLHLEGWLLDPPAASGGLRLARR